MRKIVSVLSALVLLFSATGCIKDNSCQDQTIQSEAAAIAAYASANSIAGTTHASGIYYQHTTVGTGASPTISSTVVVRYTGKLLDGTVFDTQTATPVTFQVAGTVPGFQVALQLMKEGGVTKVLIPSSLAYGCSGSGPIPGNAILYFELELVDVI